MFATLPRRALVLASSCAVALAAAGLATSTPEGITARLDDQWGPGPGLAHSQALPPPAPRGSPPGVLPKPGEVAVCDQPGTDEVVALPDTGAPEGGRPLWIRRPPGPDSADLPVLYLLHGSASTHETLMRQDLGVLLEREMCRSGVEFVIAAPHGQATGGATTEWADAADGGFALESFVTGAAVAAVEGGHRRPRALRAVGGFSMGGYGAAAIALRHPDLYGQAASWGGYFRVDDPDGVFGRRTDAHAPDRLLDSERVRGLRFSLVEGRDDHTPLQEGSIHGEADRFARLLAARGMTVATAHPLGGHDFGTWKRTFPDTVDFLVAGWSATP